jgi:lipopolysaccharide transport protein LptA
MMRNNRKLPLVRLIVVLLLSPAFAAAQLEELDLRLPWGIDADSTSYDGKTATLIFKGLRLSRGTISIEADEGRVTNRESADSTWQFSGNVVIEVESGQIECEAADLEFAENQLNRASVTGSPAKFRLTRPGSEEATYAEAGKLSYDVPAGVIEFSDQATITEAGNEISSNFLLYNIADQRIEADSNGDDSERVRIRYTPATGEIAPDDAVPEVTTESDEDTDSQ